MAFYHALYISGFARLHGSWATGELLEQGNLLILVSDITAIKHSSSFELAIGVVLIQLGILLNQDGEDPPKVGLFPCFW